MHSVYLPLYVYFSHFGRKSLALSIFLSISVKYICMYPESKYGLNATFSFGDVSRNSSHVYSFGSLPGFFNVSSSILCFRFTYASCFPFPPIPFICSLSVFLFSIYYVLSFTIYGIPLTLIGMHMLNWFTSKPNVDVENAIFPSIIFTVNADGIKYCLKYWRPSPMIIHVIPSMVS